MAEIKFKINGIQYTVDPKLGPDFSLNEYIRNVADLRGTKAMCHEGGCGACVVAVRAAMPPSNEVKTFAVNSCLVAALSCNGWEVLTTEGIGNRVTGYHEIQKRLAKFNGTQCGFCTPGWVMNMYCLYESKNKNLSMSEIENSFAGNICRCTGYRSIADAFKSFASDADDRLLNKLIDLEDLPMKKCGSSCKQNCRHKNKAIENDNVDDWCVLGNVKSRMIIIDCGTHKWYTAYTLDDVYEAMSQGDYKLIAGNTGQGVYHVTDLPANVIDIFNVSDLKGYYKDVNIIVGAGMPLTEMVELFAKLSEKDDFSYLKQFCEHMDLVAHIPVKNIGTIGGNLYLKYCNTEFQSDLFLLFETVGAMLTIASRKGKETISFPQFLNTDMKGKVIFNVMLPPLSKCCSLKTYKIMPRSQNAHAIVNAGFLFRFHHSSKLLEKVSIVYGGISPKFIHANKTEAALVGKDPFTNNTLQQALEMLSSEIDPVEAPPEPSASFRKALAINLYYKAILSLCPNDKIDPKYRSGAEAIKRSTSKGTQTFDTDKSLWPLNQPLPKLEALVQCSGEATFANDLPKVNNELFASFVTADAKPGSVISGFDTENALKIPGVVAFYTAKDIPGDNSFTPDMDAEEILCKDKVKFYGQPAAIIVANREKIANNAAKSVKIKYSTVNNDKPLLTIEDVLSSSQRNARIKNDSIVKPTETGNDVKYVVNGNFKIEAQYHYYMETQTCVAVPTEEGMEIHSSTQWLDLVNVAVAKMLKVPVNSITVMVRRVGGGYGGKISRASQTACAAALVSHLTGKTCRFIMPLQTNMAVVGKRYPTNCAFEVGVNNDGEIQYLKNTFYQDCGISTNENVSVTTATYFLNCYDSKRWYIEANTAITDTPSNTWCRAPSSTEGVAMIENIMEKIAFTTKQDSIQVRLKNMKKEDNSVPELIEQLKLDSNYTDRQAAITTFNSQNRWRKRSLKLLPLTFDLFYYGNFNSLISIYVGDGSVTITHGGVEMGQGLNTKVAQVCAYTLGIPLDKVNVKPSSTVTSPNTTATGGSIGSECIAYATLKACQIILDRLKPIKEKNGNASWEQTIKDAYNAGVDLQASYMYSKNDNLKPYEIYGVVVLELELDVLTGNHEVLRVDLLEDVGRSLNPEIDVTQIEGALIMGLGYWSSEKLIFDKNTGQLLTDRTWNYKPLQMKDIPADMRIYFRRNGKNEAGVLQSKATGEPAICFATVLIHALREAIRAARLDAGHPDEWIDIEMPCTVENIFTAVQHRIQDFKLK